MSQLSPVAPANSHDAAGLANLLAHYRQQSGSGSTADAVHGALVEGIELGWLVPGSRLGEEFLAGHFSVSRTPVREALMRLEAERLVARDRTRGLIVVRITVEQIIEMYVVREALDGAAAKLAATHAGDLDLSELDQVNLRMAELAQAGQADQMAEQNIRFHAVLARASRNRMLEEFIGQVHRYVRRFRTTTFSRPERATAAVEEHARIVAALRQRDGAAAELTAREHMRNALQVRIELETDARATTGGGRR
jgi:DNA-binding GntR family transcriptional regulator